MERLRAFGKAIATQLVNDWKTLPVVLFWECVGTVAGLTASFTLAFAGKGAPLGFIFICYFISSVTLAWTAKQRGNAFLIALNLGYAVVNIVGLSRVFF